ncbi:MAG: hypothetical protein AAF682_21585 [Planctomycetota bacterium]
MARFRIKMVPARKTGPLTFWVHRPLDHEVWAKATTFDPELPPKAEDGWPLYIAEHLGHEVWFASPEELEHAIEVLQREVLPSPEQLAAEAGHADRAYMHWIATFPARLKAGDERRRFVGLLEDLRAKIADSGAS